MHALPTLSAESIDPAWLTSQLKAAGVLIESKITACTRESVGNGLVGSSLRFSLQYDTPEPGAPASIVGKFPSTDPTSRESASFMRLYLRESQFYRRIAPRAKIHTPRVLTNLFDPITHDFILLFADLAPARCGDQLAGCDEADAGTCLREIAGLHAPFWGDTSLDDIDWLGLPVPATERIAQMAAPVADMFQERFSGKLEPDIMDAIVRLKKLAHDLMFYQAPARTVLHGDFRLDNVLFEPNGGAGKLATVDWQTISLGCGTLDASYFIGAGLREADRTAQEIALMRLYHETLLAHGVRDYGWDQCWHDYRKHSLNGLFMTMFSAISVARTERGDEMFLTMARRQGRQALELDSFRCWE